VCGCDGLDYESPCEAAQAGVRVSAIGQCECQTNDECAPDEFCDAEVCDGPGVCALRNDPECTPRLPVVACEDGATYQDICVAHQQGVRVRPN
jgi:hypothetical protein